MKLCGGSLFSVTIALINVFLRLFIFIMTMIRAFMIVQMFFEQHVASLMEIGIGAIPDTGLYPNPKS